MSYSVNICTIENPNEAEYTWYVNDMDKVYIKEGTLYVDDINNERLMIPYHRVYDIEILDDVSLEAGEVGDDGELFTPIDP